MQASPAPATDAGSSFPEAAGFRILEEIGRSPRGIIYKARRLVENDVVALKIFRRSVCEKKFMDQLAKHAEGTFFLEHSGLVRCLGCINENGRLMLVMDYVQGEPISRMLKERKAFVTSRAMLTALQCANALQYAASHKHHHGRLHAGDVILGGSNAKVLSIGLGERPDHAAWTAKDPYLFEPLVYTAPEAMPSKPFPEKALARGAADIYSLGAVLYHMLTGIPPFKGTDEGALDVERKVMKTPVAWPTGIKLPQEAIDITEKMLAPDPQARPTFEKLIPALTDALFAAEKAESAKGGAAAVAANSPKALGHSGALGGVRTASAPAAVEVHAPRAPRPPSTRAFEPYRKPQKSNFSATVLVALTSIAFLFALVKVYLYEPAPKQPQAIPNTNVPQTPVAKVEAPPLPAPEPGRTPVIPPDVPPAVPVNPPSIQKPIEGVPPPTTVSALNTAGNDQVLAARQFEMIEDMIKRGEVQHSAALLRVVRGIAEKAGKDTPLGLKAILLSAEIEETLVKNFGAAPSHAGVQANPANPAPTGATNPATPPQAQPAAALQNDEAKLAAEAAAAAKAAKDKEAALKRKAELSAALKSLMSKAAKFQYAEGVADAEKAALSGDDEKKLFASYLAVVKHEHDFFMRCRGYLLQEIERSPRKESPLQVFPRKNDPVGDDIIDFDVKGLKIMVRKGATPGATVIKEWEKVPAAQAFLMLQLLGDKKNIDDQLGLAAFAFSRGLGEKCNGALEVIRSINNGKEKADAQDEVYKQVMAATEGN
jgi:hypothetical protein